MATTENSFDQPLLSEGAQFELVSETVQNKHIMQDLDVNNNLELAYNDNNIINNSNCGRQAQFIPHARPHPQNPYTNYTVVDDIDERENNGQRSQRSSTSQMYSHGTNHFEIDIENRNNNNFNKQSHSIYTDTSSHVEPGYATIEGRIQRCGWSIWIILCICCPIVCPFVIIWYVTSTCIRPRCYLISTMLISMIWVWIDEISDVIFIYLLINKAFLFDTDHHTNFLLYLYISCIVFNHFCNVILSFIIRNNWSHDVSVEKQYQYLHHKTIPVSMKYLSLLFVGILNVSSFNTICKTYYLVQNRNNVGTIYIDQRFPCSRSSHLSDKEEDHKNNTLSKNEKLQKWYNKLYDMEALSIKEMFNAMLEKEAQIYPLLILCQFVETVPKLIIFCVMSGWTQHIHGHYHAFISIKLIMAILSFCGQIKACFISCANAEFIEQFNHD